MSKSKISRRWFVFPTELGWMALVFSEQGLARLAFGYPRREAAIRAIAAEQPPLDEPPRTDRDLVLRLQAYAQGEPVDFRDVQSTSARRQTFNAA